MLAVVWVGRATAQPVPESEPPPVCANDPAPGREFVRSILQPTEGEVDAARESARALRAEFGELDAALTEILANTPDERLEAVVRQKLIEPADRWPTDLRRKLEASFLPSAPNIEALIVRASLGDDSDGILTRLVARCDSAEMAFALSLAHRLRGDAAAALVVEERWNSNEPGWDRRRAELVAAADSEFGAPAWIRIARDGLLLEIRVALWLDGGSYAREKFLWRVFDAAVDDTVRAAALIEIAGLFLSPIVRSEFTPRQRRILEAASRLSSADRDPRVRSSAIHRLAHEFDLVRDPSHRDERIAAELYEFVALAGALEGEWGEAAVQAGAKLRRLGEPKRAIPVLETILRDDADTGLGWRLSGPSERHRAAIELAYCHEALGDLVAAAEWMGRVESFGKVGFTCGLAGQGWRERIERESARLAEAARGAK